MTDLFLSWSQVVKTTILLQSMDDFPAVNKVYAECKLIGIVTLVHDDHNGHGEVSIDDDIDDDMASVMFSLSIVDWTMNNYIH
jgi:hypothetical protein